MNADDFQEGMRAMLERAVLDSEELKRLQHRNEQLETALKILVNRTNGSVRWTVEELDAAKVDPRAVMLGALDLELYDTKRELMDMLKGGRS